MSILPTPTRTLSVRRLTAAFLALGVAATLVPWSSGIGVHAQAADTTKQTWKLGRGVKLTRIRYPETPNEVRVLTLIPQRGPTLDPTGAGSAFPMYELSSAMANRNGAIAGTNGDFATDYGAPVHPFMVDGELWTSGTGPGALYGITPNGVRAFVGRPNLRMVARSKGTPTQRIATWNAGTPEVSSVHAYTFRGGSAVPPPGVANPSGSDPTWCAVRLAPRSGYRWASSDRTAIERVYGLQQSACAKTRMSLGSDQGNVVLASRGTDGAGSTWLRSLAAGARVKLQYGFPEWPGVTDVAGGNTMLVNRGENVAPEYYSGAPNILWYNPRTSVGVNAACGDTDPGTRCKVFVVTVDGRQGSAGWSKGMQLPRLAKEHLNLKARFAVNLDGGASTVMWVKRRNDAYCQTATSFGGCLVSRPSASFGERVTITGLSVLSSADPNTPAGLR
jgi:Phosphodiester glycosidase